MLWEIDLHPCEGQLDREAESVGAEAVELGIAEKLAVRSARGFLIESPNLAADEAAKLATELFADATVERAVCAEVGDAKLIEPPNGNGFGGKLLHVLPKPGVMDPVAQSAEAAARDFGFSIDAIRTLRKYWIADATDEQLAAVGARILANDAIEQVVIGPLAFNRLQLVSEYRFELQTVELAGLDDAGLMQ